MRKLGTKAMEAIALVDFVKYEACIHRLKQTKDTPFSLPCYKSVKLLVDPCKFALFRKLHNYPMINIHYL